MLSLKLGLKSYRLHYYIKNILNYQYGMPFSTYMQRNALFLVGYDMLFLCFDFSVFFRLNKATAHAQVGSFAYT